MAGCLILVSMHHSVMDGAGAAAMIALWASHCRRVGQDESHEAFARSQAPLGGMAWTRDAFDRSHLMVAEGDGSADANPDYIVLPPSMAGLGFQGRSQSLERCIFYISPGALQRLKALAAPVNSSRSVANQKWVSTNDALSAFMWKAVVAARMPNVEKDQARPSKWSRRLARPVDYIRQLLGYSKLGGVKDDDRMSTHTMAVDCRVFMGDKLPKVYFGNLALLSTAQVPLTTLLSPEPSTLPDLALEIRKKVGQMSAQNIKNSTAFVNAVRDLSGLMGRF